MLNLLSRSSFDLHLVFQILWINIEIQMIHKMMAQYHLSFLIFDFNLLTPIKHLSFIFLQNLKPGLLFNLISCLSKLYRHTQDYFL